jgi:hypothetical protein
MGRREQTLARIGAGLTTMGLLAVLTWPTDLRVFMQWERLFFFLTALVVWIITEWKQSEELGSGTSSQNDIRVARELVELHARELRYLLKDTDLWTFVPSDVYSRLHNLCDRWERSVLFFQDKEMNGELSSLMEKLSDLAMKIAVDTVPEKIGGVYKTGYKPIRIVPEEEYKRLMAESKKANEIASQAWEILDNLVKKIRNRIP